MITNKLKSLVALGLAGFGMAAGLTACGEKDELMDEPSWLGNSIYERLKDDGNYQYTLRLIDDLGQTAVLSQTGSKTLFVADDATYDAFFQRNTWGVSRYDDLSMAQKKLLFNSAMVNNAYLVELLSNVSGNPPLVSMLRSSSVMLLRRMNLGRKCIMGFDVLSRSSTMPSLWSL